MKAEDWKAIDIEDAINGKRVGFQNASDGSDISSTGKVERAGYNTTLNKNIFKAKIGTYEVYFDENGTVTNTVPYKASMVGQTLKMVDTTITKTTGSTLSFTAAGNVASETVDLSELQPRDHFAMKALGELMAKMDDPDNADDANILFTCRAAYRWANGMMAAAAEARLGITNDFETGEDDEGNVTINLTITNNSSSPITIMPIFRFVLSTDGTQSSYPYNRTETTWLGDEDITIEAGTSQTFNDVVIPGNSKQYVGQHFAEYNEISGNWPNNALLYDTDGNSGTIIPRMINPSTLFTDGGSYTIVYGTPAVTPDPSA